MKLSPARTRAIVAAVVDAYHLTIAQVSELTDRQIHNLYFHKKNKDGVIEIPEAEFEDGDTPTIADRLAKFDQMAALLRWTPEKRAQKLKSFMKKIGEEQ